MFTQSLSLTAPIHIVLVVLPLAAAPMHIVLVRLQEGAPAIQVLQTTAVAIHILLLRLEAIASSPVTCELCHTGFCGFDKFSQHCRQVHRGVAEYRKRTLYKAHEAGMQPLLPWFKRNMVQSLQFFRMFSVPGSCNDWTTQAHEKAEP